MNYLFKKNKYISLIVKIKYINYILIMFYAIYNFKLYLYYKIKNKFFENYFYCS